MTDAERALWARLRARGLGGWKFRRQAPLGSFIADFLCAEARLVVEVDGGQHAESLHDAARDALLATKGYCVARYWNSEVLANMDGVLADLGGRLASRALTPALSRRRERGRGCDAAAPGAAQEPVASGQNGAVCGAFRKDAAPARLSPPLPPAGEGRGEGVGAGARPAHDATP
ncbi:Very-short-patch-repair endonuclease [Rubrimonas cliftonensis]|uniref:Very-short-patch-repair endonuclease n=2 Tax=Rubrimonas cliftonensis TaxID=89524 RepID=A0A1H4AKY4_9RHOB|nr:Very-short-patch-repair endonuclease [Rubrimonas cliftonensis]